MTVVPKKRKIGRTRSKPKAYNDFLSDVELGLYNIKLFSPKVSYLELLEGVTIFFGGGGGSGGLVCSITIEIL